jgi:hypothetical protein
LLGDVRRLGEVGIQIGEDRRFALDGLPVGEQNGDLACAGGGAELGPSFALDRHLTGCVGETELGQALAHPM